MIGQFPYDAGKIDGIAPFFYEDGELLAQVTYKEGMIEYYKEFFPDGTVRAEIEFRKGVRHGLRSFITARDICGARDVIKRTSHGKMALL